MSPGQTTTLAVSAVLFWAGATAWIRLVPSSVLDTVRGDLWYLTSIPVCWLCILLVRAGAGLSPSQLVTGTALVVAIATLIDAAAWLLWGYGITLAIALAMSRDGTPSPADRFVPDQQTMEPTA